MEILPAEKGHLRFEATGKPKKKLILVFLGSPIADIRLSDFTLHGLPVPLYTHTPKLILLFKDHADCGNYLNRLYAIKDELEAFDPAGTKPAIQGSIDFVSKVIESLI